jgi:hypothetical protein
VRTGGQRCQQRHGCGAQQGAASIAWGPGIAEGRSGPVQAAEDLVSEARWRRAGPDPGRLGGQACETAGRVPRPTCAVAAGCRARAPSAAAMSESLSRRGLEQGHPR